MTPERADRVYWVLFKYIFTWDACCWMSARFCGIMLMSTWATAIAAGLAVVTLLIAFWLDESRLGRLPYEGGICYAES